MTHLKPYAQVPHKVLLDHDLADVDVLVYVYLSAAINPTTAEIAHDLGLSIATVRRACRNLEQAEYLVVQLVPGKRNRYLLPLASE